RVWRVLCGIEFGSTITYAEEAARLGQPRALRAVGNANGRNPVPIIVPCHRVVATGGGIGGYSAGVDRKRTLLQLESR
ncbi:MAG: methylated-DNA--[protein]-cysteine S-methyltransferase, partial [Actinobacteria bacterium]|nr:methylated-DNA--[protein]-cysteine S-methyltransferase [Actinomycetota bacterium]